MKVYKYVRPERVDVLEKQLIRFTQPEYFNDPFDVSPYFSGFVKPGADGAFVEMMAKYLESDLSETHSLFQEELAKVESELGIRVDLLRNLAPKQILELVKAQLPHLAGALRREADPRAREQFGPELRRRLNEKVGILSLSGRPDQDLMWSHYAAGGRGFVIVFDSAHPFFGSSASPENHLRCLRRVEYTADRPQLALLDPDTDPDELGASMMTSIFFTKGKNWQYEEEWRLLLPVEDMDQVVPHSGHEIWLKEIPADAIVGVILGSRCDTSLSDVLTSVMGQSRYAHVRFHRAIEDRSDYRVTIVDA